MFTDQDKARIFRERFYGRQDVFGVKNYYQDAEGKKASRYAPQCSNFWSAGCGLKTKQHGCATCEIKQYTPVSDESVLKHIRGEHEIIHYVLLQDDTVKFAALDLDRKPGRESEGYSWHEVSACQQVLKGWGLPAAAARSTTLGWHLYLFLEDFVPAYKIQGLMWEVFARTGIMEANNLGLKTLPEIFPKQVYLAKDGSIGNGIKPPMVEDRYDVQRNCFVNEANVIIGRDTEVLPPADASGMRLVDGKAFEGTPDLSVPPDWVINAQWEFLNTFPKVSAALLDAVIAKEEIPVQEPAAGGGRSRSHSTGIGRPNSKWQPSINGSIEKVLEGCAALRKVRDKAKKGEILGHQEGFALFHICKATNDGLDWFAKNVPGWGQDDKQKAQLEHSIEKNYSPWTCRKMQENGICAPRTQCFKPKPRIDVVDGQNVVRDDLPESEWPQPSPIRYAYGRGEDFLRKLMADATALKAVAEGEDKLKALKAIAYRAQIFDVDQQKELKAYIRKEKVARLGDISKAFNEASADAKADDQRIRSESETTLWIHGTEYKQLSPYGYAVMKGPRANKTPTVLADVDIIIEEVRAYTQDGRVKLLTYNGTVRGPCKELKFEIESDKWEDNTEFKKYFGGILGPSFNVLRQNIDGLRQAASGFSRRYGIQEVEFLTTQGWVGDMYVMPSVVVDKDGVKPNTEKRVDLSRKAFAASFDFKIISDDDFKATMLHLKTDFLNTWPRMWTTVGLAHAMLPAMKHVLGMERRASLFFEGLTGAGKTELMCALQYFWGSFKKVLNLKSSNAGAQYEGYECKDALLSIDDYKGIDKNQKAALHDLLHYGYDGHVNTKLKRDGDPRDLKNIRCVVIATGEQFLDDSASVIARTILIEVNKTNTAATAEAFGRCQERYPLYQGVTPRFIHYLLNQDGAQLKASLATIKSDIMGELEEKVNSDRIAMNMAVNHLTWKVWTDFMLQAGVIGPKEQEDLIREHRVFMTQLAWGTAVRCETEQNSQLFISLFREMILAKELKIDNMEGFSAEGKKQVGRMADRRYGAHRAFIHPESAWQAVQAQFGNDNKLSGTARSIGRQLVEDGYVVESKEGAPTTSVKLGGSQGRYWLMDLEKLGIMPKLRVVGQEEAQPPTKATDGTF